MGTLGDKKKQVDGMHEVIKKLRDGNSQIQRFNQTAEMLASSNLGSYVKSQAQQLNSRYQTQLNVGQDVLKKVEANLEQHQQFINNYELGNKWMEK